MTRFRPPEERFGIATLAPLLDRASTSGLGLTFADGAGGERRLPFAELAAGAGTAAAALRDRGVRPGDRVCLLGTTSAEFVTVLWGVWYAGAVVVVLPPLRGPAAAEELARRIQQADARLLVVADELAAGIEGPVAGADVVTSSEVLAGRGEPLLVDSTASDLALLQFTSGTTARSRAVALTHQQLLSNLSSFSDALEFTGEDRCVSWLPLHHAMGILIMATAVAIPYELMLAPTEGFIRSPGFWMDAVSGFRASVTLGPNQAYGLAARDLQMRPRDLDLSRLRIAGGGGDVVDARILGAFAHLASQYGFKSTALRPTYGLTEATLAVTISALDEPVLDLWVDRERLEADRVVELATAGQSGARRLAGSGRPIPGVELDIRDADGASLADGRVGEIWVRGPSLMTGYWRDPDATAAVLVDGWLRTGDLGFRHGDQLVVCGRVKDMIVAGGRNLYPEDYEQLSTHPGIHGAVVAFGLVDAERMVVVAETALDEGGAQQLTVDVMRTLTQELAHAPKEVLAVRPLTLPRTPSGKVQRAASRDRYLAGELAAVASVRR